MSLGSMQQALSPAKHRNSTAEELNSNQNGSPRDPHRDPNGAQRKRLKIVRIQSKLRNKHTKNLLKQKPLNLSIKSLFFK